MRRRTAIALAVSAALAAGCAADPQKSTLAELHAIKPDAAEVPVTEGLEQAMQGYRRFLDETPETELTPEAMRRLADLQIEKQFGIRTGDGRPPQDGLSPTWPRPPVISIAADRRQRTTNPIRTVFAAYRFFLAGGCGFGPC